MRKAPAERASRGLPFAWMGSGLIRVPGKDRRSLRRSLLVVVEYPVQRWPAYAEHLGYPGDGVGVLAVPGLLAGELACEVHLLAGQLGLAAAGLAACPCGGQALERALDDQLALEFVDAGEDVEDEAAGRGGGVDRLETLRCLARSPVR